MIKNRVIPAIFVAFFLIFCPYNISFAQENICSQTFHPDYAYEFTGKDKCEKFNRKLFVFNLRLNRYILRPVNKVWASFVPICAMDRLQNAYNNINYPVRVAGCLLQKDYKASRQETKRFLINTTIGVGGLYDPAKSKFNLEPRQEDIGQALAHFKVKQGPYLVLPIIRGNVRDLVGQLLAYPLRPFSYIPIAGGIANAVCAINSSTYAQPIFKKIDESYADPYEIARQIDGISRFIKNENLDREEVLKEKSDALNIIKVKNTSNISTAPTLKSDVKLENYNPQSPFVDSLRTAMLDYPVPEKSAWSTLSVWNRCFSKKIKMGSVNIDPKHPNYKYRYILQKTKTSPVAIIYPSFGEGITSEHSDILAKILYDEGYSVVIQGSAFQWEFVKSMPDGYRPGFPIQDANYLKTTTSKILENLETKKSHKFEKKILVGTSFGALTALFVTAQNENGDNLNISKCISVNPPVNLFFSLKQMDKYCQCWKEDPSDIKMRAAITAEKTVETYKKVADKTIYEQAETLPFNDDEAKLIISLIMKQKLSDVVFSIENCTRCKKTDLYEKMNNMSFNDYKEKYLAVNQEKTPEQFDCETSLHSISDFLKNSNKYKIYHTVDDYFVNEEQLSWLKQQSNDKTVLFSNGSHLGFLYRKEFLDNFKKDIKLEPENIEPVNAPIVAPTVTPAGASPENHL